SEGFLRPKIYSSLSNPEENLFAKICPGIHIKHLSTKGHNLFLGPFIKIDVGYSIDETIRYNGSSGGVLTALSNFLLKEGKVEAILQIGSTKDSPTRSNFKLSRNREELIANAGSRYAPS